MYDEETIEKLNINVGYNINANGKEGEKIKSIGNMYLFIQKLI